MKNKTIFVTGAGQGLGRVIALTCAARGATLILHGRSAEKLDLVYDEIVDAGHAEPYLMPLDLAKASLDAFAQVGDAVSRQCRALDGLIHCAAELGAVSPIEHQSAELLRNTWLTNTLGPIMLTRALGPALRAAGQPTIVFTTDSHVATPGPFWGGYGISKAAIAQFAAQLQCEWDFAKIHAIAPGAIDSPLRNKTHPGEARSERVSLTNAAQRYIDFF